MLENRPEAVWKKLGIFFDIPSSPGFYWEKMG
jgi:hypothetical protein